MSQVINFMERKIKKEEAKNAQITALKSEQYSSPDYEAILKLLDKEKLSFNECVTLFEYTKEIETFIEEIETYSYRDNDVIVYWMKMLSCIGAKLEKESNLLYDDELSQDRHIKMKLRKISKAILENEVCQNTINEIIYSERTLDEKDMLYISEVIRIYSDKILEYSERDVSRVEYEEAELMQATLERLVERQYKDLDAKKVVEINLAQRLLKENNQAS